MGQHFIAKDELIKRLDLYYLLKRPYLLQRQGNSVFLIIDKICYYTYSLRQSGDEKENNCLPIKEVSFISTVKRHIINNNLHEKIPANYKNKSEIKYIDFNKKTGSGEYFDNCYCVDINNAYWEAARMQGFINGCIYKEGLTKDKRIRLACLGTFAKVISTIEFDGEREIIKPDVLPTHPHIFFNSANIIYKCVDACKKGAGEDFLFYWTDCVYVKNKASLEKCVEIIKGNGFESKTQEIERVAFSENAILVNGKNNKKEKKYLINL